MRGGRRAACAWLAACALVAAGLGGGAARADRAPPKAAPAPLRGETIDFPYGGEDVQKPRLAWTGRAFLHEATRAPAGRGEALPLVVFLHGLNKELIPHRWMGGGTEGDVRRLVAAEIEAGRLPPVLVAGPGSVVPEEVSRGASFASFDLDVFLDRAEAALGHRAKIDPSRIVVLGHSGAGCSAAGGILAALRSKRPILGVASIDTCMGGGLARDLAAAPPRTHVVVTWQEVSWKRPFEAFSAIFRRGAQATPPAPGVLRELDRLPPEPRPHDATVGQTIAKWLPRMLVPAPR